jgi:channel protein (hemolysin III family)
VYGQAVSKIIGISGFSEPFSSMTHLFSAGIFFVIGIWLIVKCRGNRAVVASVSVFVFGSVFLLAMSGVFHLLEPGGSPRFVLQRLDHAGIFLLIAGSFTGVHGILFSGFWRWGMLLFVWTFAITAITLKSIYFDDMPEALSLALYLGMGWLGAITGYLLYRRHDFHYIKALIFGALAYTVGAVIEFIRVPPLITGVIGAHEIFHLAVLLGLGFHFWFIARIGLDASRNKG